LQGNGSVKCIPLSDARQGLGKHVSAATYTQQADGKSVQHPVQQHLPQQEIQKTGLSVQAPSSINNETLKIVSVVQHITTELNIAVSEKENITVITKIVLKLMKQNGC
jgi:hypothetical protein